VSRKYNNPCPCSSEWSHPQQDCTMYCDKYYAYLLTKDFNELEAERDRLQRKLDDWKEEVHRHMDEVVARIGENEQLQEEIEGYKQYNQAIMCANEELRAENERLRETLELLRPVEGYITEDMPDDEAVSLEDGCIDERLCNAVKALGGGGDEAM
jgi:chromosome condensin MukBEF ATPase and DNA-binding subunit MukB